MPRRRPVSIKLSVTDAHLQALAVRSDAEVARASSRPMQVHAMRWCLNVAKAPSAYSHLT